MALGNSDFDSSEIDAPETDSSAKQDTSEFLYLRDLMSALDMTSLSLSIVVRLLEAEELSDEVRKALNFVAETDQVRVHARDILDKIEKVSAAVEGTLQAVSALEVSRRTSELLKSAQ